MVDITKLSLQEIYRLAEDENTSPKVLSLLSNKKNNSILQRIASNPNTPISVLEKLSFQFPDEIINNPVCALLYLENLKQMDFLNIAMAKSESTSEDELIKLAKNNNYEIHNILLERNNLSAVVLKLILDKSNWNIRWTIANSQNISVETLRYSANYSNIYVRESVAKNPKTPREILHKLATDSEKSVREQVAQNKNTSIDTLNFLVKDIALSVVSFVAANPNTPTQLLRFLAIMSNKSESYIREKVAGNSNTSVNTLKLLAVDSDPLVRKEVARNINAPLSILKRLFLDSNSEVRSSVVENKNLPQDFIKTIDEPDKIKFLNFYTKPKNIVHRIKLYKSDRKNNKLNEPITLDVSIFKNISECMAIFLVRSVVLSEQTQEELLDYDGINTF